jgi:hypothetical protein
MYSWSPLSYAKASFRAEFATPPRGKEENWEKTYSNADAVDSEGVGRRAIRKLLKRKGQICRRG